MQFKWVLNKRWNLLLGGGGNAGQDGMFYYLAKENTIEMIKDRLYCIILTRYCDLLIVYVCFISFFYS